MAKDYEFIHQKIQNLTEKIKMCRESIKSGFALDTLQTGNLIKEKQKVLNMQMTLGESMDKNTYELVKNLDQELNSLECPEPLKQDALQDQSLYESKF